MTHTPTVQSQPGGVPGRKRAISALITVALTGGILGSALSQPASAVGAPGANTASASTVTVTQQPSPTTVNSGDQASFSAAFSDPSLTVHWQSSTDSGTTFQDVDATANPSALTGTLTLNPHVSDSGTVYRAYVTDAQGGSTATNGASLTVNAVAPTVTQQPADSAVADGDNATFTAAFAGDPAPSIQWYKTDPSTGSASPIAGATNPQLVLPSVSLADDNSQYYAVATNSAGEITTNPATLHINRAPALDYGPDDQVSSNGTDVTFTASANGYPDPTVQWQRSNDGGASFSNIAGANTYAYTFTPVSTDDGSRYRAVFTNGSGTLTTASALLYYEITPAITTQPAPSTTAEAGRPLTLTSAASGQPTPAAQWQVYDASQAMFVNIASATSPSYTFTPTVADDNKNFRVVYTNSFGHSVTSATANVRVTPTNPPSVPQNVAATQTGPGTVTITWDAPADSGTYPVSGYDVGLGAGQSGDGQTVGPTARSAVFSGLSNGDYTASVAAFSEVGSGPRSPFVTVTVSDAGATPPPPAPTAVAPSAPRAVTATLVGAGAVTVTWTTPASSGSSPITGYTPGYSHGQSGNGTDVASTVRSYTFRGLALGTYTFSVGATSADGSSPRTSVTFTLATQAAPTISVTSALSTIVGRGISFTGRGTPGATLTLQRLVIGEAAFTNVRTITVSSGGTYTTSVAAFKTAVYRMHEVTGKVSSNSARITVASSSSLTAVRNGVRTYTLSGTVRPGTGAAQKITIAYLHNGAYSDLAAGNTDSRGRWTFTKTYRSSGTYTFRVTVAATAFNAAGATISRIAIQ